MLSSPRLAALSRPFGSLFRSHFWLSGFDDIQEQLHIGATLLFSLGSVWLEICSTSLFLDTFGLRALAGIYGAIALLSLSRQIILTQVPLPKFLSVLLYPHPGQSRWQVLWLLPLTLIVLTPFSETTTLPGFSGGPLPIAQLQVGVIQLWAVLLRQQRTAPRANFTAQPADPAGAWIQLLGSAIAAAALLCLLPVLTGNNLDLHSGLNVACVILLIATLLKRQLPAEPLSSRHTAAREAQDSALQNAPANRYFSAAQSHTNDPSAISESLLGLRLRQSGRVFLALFGIAQFLGCLTEIQLLKQWLGLAALSPVATVLSDSSLASSALGIDSLAFVLCWLYITIGFGGFTLQTLIDRRIFRRYGAFVALGILPMSVLGFSLLGLSGLMPPSRWTIWIMPALYGIWQTTLLPDAQRKLLSFLPQQSQQSIQRNASTGVAIAWGIAGLSLFFLGATVSSPLLWSLLGGSAALGCGTILLLRLHYVKLLIATVAEGRLQASQFEPGEGRRDGDRSHRSIYQSPLLTRAITQALKASLRSPIQLLQAQQSIQLLAQVDLAKACETLMPLLPSLPPSLQLSSLSVLQQQPDKSHEIALRHLLTPVTSPEVYAATLKYLLKIAPPASAQSLLHYLKSDVQVPIRAVAAAYMMAYGDSSTQRSASLAFVQMLGRDSEVERLVGAEALKEAGDLERLQQYITPLLQDFSLPVRAALLQAIAETRSRSLYDHLLQALHSPMTQEIARTALQTMGDEGLQLLQKHCHNSAIALDDKLRTWDTLAQLHTLNQQQGSSRQGILQYPDRRDPQAAHQTSLQRKQRETGDKQSEVNALNILALELTQNSGVARQHLLKLLLQQPKRAGIRAVQQILGKKTGIMALVQEELWLLGHLYAALVDLDPKTLDPKHTTPSAEVRVFREALIEQQRNVGERVLLLLQFLYPRKSMKLAARKLRDRDSIPQGLVILERLLEPEIKPRVLAIFGAQSASKKLAQLKRWVAYEPLPGQQRLRSLLSLKPGLDDWPHACAFHLACHRQWRVSDDQLLQGLNHPNLAVQDAAKSYLGEISSGTLDRLLPRG